MAFAFPSETKPLGGWLNRQIARPEFQAFASKVPIVRNLARRDGAELFDIVQGFVRSQVLYALVSLKVPERLMDGPLAPDALALATGINADRMQILLQGGAGIGVLKRKRNGRFALTRKGAALVGVPGLRQMILHHGAFYRDMEDPVALLKGESETELAGFWPYVFGATGEVDPVVTRTYSDLMAESQGLVARDTLATISLDDVRHLADIGGGSGAFLIEVARAYPDIDLTLFDLPAVMPSAQERIASAGLTNRIACQGGSFREDALPSGVDAISLVRVLYDHDDESVLALLQKVLAALPPGGRLVISEPMSGGAAPDPITDVYFAFYTLAMRTGRTRSAEDIASLCTHAGFAKVEALKPRRSYVTSVVTAVKSG
ncbi:MAG: methyltransferase [Paracoccaceae bacterium]|nr:methyltransferase [Paracoccaceae bacterium]